MSEAPATSPHAFASPPTTMILTILLLIFFFIGFFSVFFCRYFVSSDGGGGFRHIPPSSPTLSLPQKPPPPPGLDPAIINSFPTFVYSAVKDLRIEKYGLECAVCICEFLEVDELRLLPQCCHVFHQECIDLWLEKNKTCPVCRTNLEIIELPKISNMCGINEDEPLEDSVRIDIPDDGRREIGGERVEARVDRMEMSDKFPRSHSTGHSIKKKDDLGVDKFTLRLPENIHARILRRHKWTGSLTTFGEFTSRSEMIRGGFGEISDFA